MDWQKYGQAEEVQASSEGEVRGVERTRPAGKAKERVTEERVSMKAKDELEAKEDSRSENSVMDEDQENITAMTSEETKKKHKEDVMRLVEMVQKEEMELEMMQQE